MDKVRSLCHNINMKFQKNHKINLGRVWKEEHKLILSKAHKGKKPSLETIKKMRASGFLQSVEKRKKIGDALRGDKNYAWKGDAVGYYTLHQWLNRLLGNAKKCSKDSSHTSKRFVWANKSGQYKRDISDWHELCNSCNIRDGIKVPDRLKYKYGKANSRGKRAQRGM